jgi:hypothetical protein
LDGNVCRDKDFMFFRIALRRIKYTALKIHRLKYTGYLLRLGLRWMGEVK